MNKLVMLGTLCSLLGTMAGCAEKDPESRRDRLAPLYAASTDNVKMLRDLQEDGMSLDDQYPERYNWTPLMAAVYLHRTNATAFLLEQELDLGKTSSMGTTLMVAIRSYNTNAGAAILRKQLQAPTVVEDWGAIRTQIATSPMSNTWFALIRQIANTNLSSTPPH